MSADDVIDDAISGLATDRLRRRRELKPYGFVHINMAEADVIFHFRDILTEIVEINIPAAVLP